LWFASAILIRDHNALLIRLNLINLHTHMHIEPLFGEDLLSLFSNALIAGTQEGGQSL
jgi:hypothetical protein